MEDRVDLSATWKITAPRQALRRLAPSLVLMLSCVVVSAQAPVPDTSSIGPQVGDRIPEFSGTDQFGKPHTLASLLGPSGAMIVFFRSADW